MGGRRAAHQLDADLVDGVRRRAQSLTGEDVPQRLAINRALLLYQALENPEEMLDGLEIPDAGPR